MDLFLIIFAAPLTAALLAAILRNTAITRKIVPILCWLQIPVLVCVCLPLLNGSIKSLSFSPNFTVDRLSTLFLLLTTFVCACSLSHAEGFFEREQVLSSTYKPDHERTFYSCAALFLLAMSSIFLCDNLGILWVSMEATTLSSAALVYFSRTKHSLEATWKYLIICSVGIAFALLGTVLIFAASQHGALPQGSLSLTELTAHASSLQYPLLRLGYIFCLVGYGTKAGIFPLHSWLPDAHSEAPAPASAMLSGALLNCALFAIWRLSQLVGSAHYELLACSLPLTLGALTALAASLFLVRQHGIKRLWAYSSIENVGIMLIAIALGSGPLFFLQAFNHSISKVALFLLAGNVIQATGSKELTKIRGILNASPAWGLLIGLSAFAVTGAPPFGAFISEWLILTRSADQGQWLVVAALIVALALSFVAVCIHVAGILFGAPKAHRVPFRPIATSLVPSILVACAIASGITALPFYMVKP
jgi:hydrogenase-4 component F